MRFSKWFKDSSGRRPTRRRRVLIEAFPEILEPRSLLSTIALNTSPSTTAPAMPILVSPGSTTSPGPILTTSTANSIATSTPTLIWKPDSGATSYVITIDNITASTNFTHTITASSTSTGTSLPYSFAVPAGTLAPGDQFSWQLTAANAGGNSPPSALLYFQTQVAAPPTPTLVSPGISSTSNLPILPNLTPTLMWNADPGATSYLINIHNITTNTYFTPTVAGGSTTSYPVPANTLAPGDQYSWHLYAENAGGSSMSALLYFQTQVAAPAMPILVSPGSTTSPGPILTTSSASTTPTLTPTLIWKPDSGATSYMITINNITTGTNFTHTITASSTSTGASLPYSFAVPAGTLAPGDQYRWQLTAANAGGNSPPSALLYFQTQVAAPPTPTLVSPGISSTSSVPILPSLTPTLMWNADPGATSYLINIHNITTNTYFEPTVTGGSTTSYPVPANTLAPGDLYSWHLYAENAGGSSMSALLYFQTQVAAPATPVLVSPGSTTSPGPILTGSSTSSTPTLTPTLIWKPDSGATSYVIIINNITTGTNFTHTITASSTSTGASLPYSFAVPAGTLAAGDQYRWQLTAANAGGNSPPSALLYFQTQVAAPPTPTLVSPGISSTSNVPILPNLTPTLMWNADPGATSYLINIHNITTNTSFTATVTGGSTTSYPVPANTLAPGDLYSWHLYGENAGGSSMSAMLYFQTQVAAPATPVLVSPGSTTAPGPFLTSSTANSTPTLTPTLIWKPDSGATSYVIIINNITTGTNFTHTITASSTSTGASLPYSFAVPAGTLAAGDQYRWQLTAANAGGNSRPSALLYFQTQVAAPPTPTLVSPGSTGTSNVPILPNLTPTLMWNADPGATSYLINIHNITTNTYFEPTVTGGSTTSYPVLANTLAPGDQYSWHLYAENAGGSSQPSTLLYFQTQAITLTPPTLLGPGLSSSPGSKLTTLAPTFTWDAVNGATSYLIAITNLTTKSTFTQTITGGSTTIFTVPTGTLAAGDQYSWHLYALSGNAGTSGSASAVWYFET